MKSYSTYIFDWDGCLAKTLDIWLLGYHKFFNKRDIHVTDREIVGIFGDWNGPSKLGVQDEEQFFAELKPYVQKQLTNVELYPTAYKTVTKFKKQQKQIAIVSSSLTHFIKPALKKHGLDQHIDLLLSGEDVTRHKPDPEGICKVIKKFDADKKTTLMVGDMDMDVLAARNAGIDSALVYPEHHQLFYDFDKLQQTKPTYTIKELSELISNIA